MIFYIEGGLVFMDKKAIVLLSGGLDSTTVLAHASASFSCYALSFHYDQRHAAELKAASHIAQLMGVVDHQTVDLPRRLFEQSSLVNRQIPLSDHKVDVAGDNPAPTSYVPARNTIFLSYALAWAETIQADAIFIGVSAIDYSGYPDCRPEYIRAFQTMADLATQRGVSGQGIAIEAPLLHLTKAQTIMMGLQLGVDYSQTVSCYRANDLGQACGACDSCYYRKKAFAEAGIADPTPYAEVHHA